MIQRDVDATLLPQTYEVKVTDWTFVPTSSKTPDTPAYYIARVYVRSSGCETSEDAIVALPDLQATDRAALDELVQRTVNVATLKAKARLDDSLARPATTRFKRPSLRRV